MAYDVEFTEEFRVWYEEELRIEEQESVVHVVQMLEQSGPALKFPYSSGIV